MKGLKASELAALGAAIAAIPLLAPAAAAAPVSTHDDLTSRVTPSAVIPPRIQWLTSTRHDWLAATETAFRRTSARYRAHHGLADYRRRYPLGEYRARYPFVTPTCDPTAVPAATAQDWQQATAYGYDHSSARYRSHHSFEYYRQNHPFATYPAAEPSYSLSSPDCGSATGPRPGSPSEAARRDVAMR